MNKDQILNKVQDIFRDIFDDDDILISDNTIPEEIKDWDSLNHVLLISSVQEEFNIKVDLEDSINMIDVKGILKVIAQKLIH